MSKPSKPLAGFKVLEMAQIMAGPVAGQMLADLGAEVIKVEKMPGGDDTRSYAEPRINGVSAPFLMLNRGKRGLALNLKHPRGREVLFELVRKSDALIENFRKGTLEKFSAGYEDLRKINPRLIYCAISGYGRTGPYADKGGFDLIAQGFSGLMSITGEPGRPPVKPGTPVADINAGILAVNGIMAAHIHCLKTGEGQLVETSLMEAAMHQTHWHAGIYFATGQSPEPTGSAHVLTAPYQAFRTADGHINIGGANATNWQRVCHELGHPEWASDQRFKENADRMANREALVQAMESVLETNGTEYWVARFDAAGVPAGPVHQIGQAVQHPQALAREMVVQTKHPDAGEVRSIGNPVKLSASPGSSDRPAPRFGEHTRDVLEEFGFAAADIDELISAGVVHQGETA
ncbi:MAG: CaiB/BaiF CoA transferase family protein [Burkholderiaceae bacterium]